MLCQLETFQKQNVDEFKSKFESGAQMCSNWWRHFRGGASTNCNTFKCQNKIAKLSKNTHYLFTNNLLNCRNIVFNSLYLLYGNKS